MRVSGSLGPFTVALATVNGPKLVMSWAEARAEGYSEMAIRHKVRRGYWQLLHPGLLYIHSGRPPRRALIEASLAHAGEGAVLDGPTAASLRGLNEYHDSRIHVRVPHHRHPERRPGLVIRRTRHLEPNSWSVYRDLPTIKLERAVLTIAATRMSCLGASVQEGLTTPARLRGVLLSLGPIKKRAQMLTTLDDVEGGSRSELELLFLRQVRRAKLPLPVGTIPS